jgi:hypothetical protein
MSDTFTAFTEVCAPFVGDPDIKATKLFGRPCLQVNGHVFVALLQDSLLAKLPGADRMQALALDGAQLFDPSGKGRPMKEWVQIPYAHVAEWLAFAAAAHDYVATLPAKR